MVSGRNNKGISLVEVLIVVAILGIMGTIAIPAMISWRENKAIQGAGRDMYSNFRKAQSIAVKNNRNCAVSFDGVKGYEVYVEEPMPSSNKKYQRDSNEQVIAKVEWSQYRNVQLGEEVKFAKNTLGQPTVVFQPTLIPTSPNNIPNGTVKLINTGAKKAAVAVSGSGNISLEWDW
jgi:prepilin-type N-terminal cleavage/methylation domain-containing protein